MEEQVPNLGDYLAILKRRKWHLIVPIVLFAPIAVVVALTLPAVYRSTATILIEQQEIPADLIRTTVTSFADERIQSISHRVMTSQNLGKVIEKYNLYPEIREKQSLNSAVVEMRQRIALEMINANVVDPKSGSAKKATIAFTISFEDPAPTLAQKVTNDLVSLFLNENLRQREAAVEEASIFLGSEAEKLADQIRELDAALAKFKEGHRDNLPENHALNRELMERTEQQIRDNEQTLRTLDEQQLYLETELSQLDPQLILGTAGGGRTQLSPEARLQELEVGYVGVKSRYAPTHPDRLQMEREIAALRKEVGRYDTTALRERLAELNTALAAARERYSRKHPDVQSIERDIAVVEKRIAQTGKQGGAAESGAPQKAENPAFVQLQARLEAIKLDIKGLREAQQGLASQRAIYEQRLIEAPNVERQYRGLTLDFDNAMTKYREVKDKQMEAELAKALESERKGERFTLIEPPLVPEEPEKPNRPAIMMLGLVLSFGGGFGNLALREVMDKSVHGARAVLAITQAPPLAVIPYMETEGDRRRRRRRLWIVVLAIGACLLIGVAALHFAVMPLDLLWFRLLRRINDALAIMAPTFDGGSAAWSA